MLEVARARSFLDNLSCMAITVNLIGAGRVGQTFLRVLSNLASVVIGDVLSRNPENAVRAVADIGKGRAVKRLEEMNAAQLWLIAVPDDQISVVAEEISRRLSVAQAERPVAVHFSGFLPSNVLEPLKGLGWLIASCHPVLSFADPVSGARQFGGIHCGTEGDPAAIALLDPLLSSMGARTFTLNSESKALYHAGAVFSNNFTVVLQAIALEAWAQSGIDTEVAEALCATLLGSASANVVRLGPQAALTGPAARGDRQVVLLQKEHVAVWHSQAGEIYDVLSEMASRLKQSGTTVQK